MLPSSQARCCISRHRAGSIRANTTTARAPPSRERVADSDCTAGFAELATVCVRASRVRLQPRCQARQRSLSSPARCCSSRHRAGAPAQSKPTRRPRERRQAASESSILIVPPASPSVCRPPPSPRTCGRSRGAECANAPLEPRSLLLPITAPARSKPTRGPLERRRVASVPLILVAPPASPRRASTSACASCVRLQPPRRVRRCSPRAQPELLLLTSPRRLNQSQHDDRESAAELLASRRS